MKSLTIFFTLALLLASNIAFAQGQANQSNVNDKSAYQDLIVLPPVQVLVPTVVEVPIAGTVFTNSQFLVNERGTDQYLGSYFKRIYTPAEMAVQAQTNPAVTNSRQLVDKNLNTNVDFDLPESGPGSVIISLYVPASITTSEIRFSLAPHVSFPETVSVVAKTNQGQKTLVATRPVDGSSITFPETNAQMFNITFTYAQPLRLSEISLVPKTVPGEYNQTLRFLAQPGKSYDVYFNPDHYVPVSASEVGNLTSDEDVLLLGGYPTQNNPYYVPADVDDDGVRDTFDNCVTTYNPDQADINGNGRGDACEDYDRDGIMNDVDNCINQPNQFQSDEDGDGIGDACDQEESRFTERNPWIPWVGIGLAAVVLGILFALVATGARRKGGNREDGKVEVGSGYGLSGDVDGTSVPTTTESDYVEEQSHE